MQPVRVVVYDYRGFPIVYANIEGKHCARYNVFFVIDTSCVAQNKLTFLQVSTNIP